MKWNKGALTKIVLDKGFFFR